MSPPQPAIAIRLVGPLEVEVSGEPVVLRRRRERGLLIVFALLAGRPMPPDRLLDLVWGDDATTDRSVLHTAVSRLRAALDDGARGGRAQPCSTSPVHS